MQLSPRYDGPPIIEIDGAASDQRAPFLRQRRRLQQVLATLSEQEWRTESRCAGWSCRDVVAHLAGVNQFWLASLAAGLRGEPTRWLGGFDPAATPAQMVAATADQPNETVLGAFAATNDQLESLLDELHDADWSRLAEAPPGHLPIRLVVSHALWDGWVHERDILLPLRRTPEVVADEVVASLRYVAALSGAFCVLFDTAPPGEYTLVSSAPTLACRVTVSDHVRVSDAAPDRSPLALTGDGVELVEALSFRSPVPEATPDHWRRLLSGLETAFAPAN